MCKEKDWIHTLDTQVRYRLMHYSQCGLSESFPACLRSKRERHLESTGTTLETDIFLNQSFNSDLIKMQKVSSVFDD